MPPLSAVERRHPAGAVALEFAIVLPMLLLCICGIIEFGRLLWMQATLDYAVQSAARCAQTNTALCGSVAQIKTFAAGAAPGLGVDPANFAVSAPTCGVQVSVTVPFQPWVPWGFPTPMQLTAQACYPS